MTLEVLQPGQLTTVQDRGRTGARHLGVGLAGVADEYSACVANLLVGNADDAALLEITLTGPVLRSDRPLRIAITGADIDARADGVVLPNWRTIELPAGCELRFGACMRGLRGYLAIAGGIASTPFLGSRATDLRAGFGGIQGRALRRGDSLPLGESSCRAESIRIAKWWIDPRPDLDFDRVAIARVLPGRDGGATGDALFAEPWRVTARSDRQGLRLSGAPLSIDDHPDRISEPVTPGTLQLPPDGQPIVLLADAQTCGGYPRIGHVVGVDLPRLAQCRPGDVLRFAPCTWEQAHAARRARRQRLQRIALAIAQRGFPR